MPDTKTGKSSKPKKTLAPQPAEMAPQPAPMPVVAISEKGSLVSRDEAQRMDAAVTAKIKDHSESLARTYLEVGAALKAMHDTKAYLELEFTTWEKYLESKTEFKRTYLSYLFKLGQAGDLQPYLDRGVSASKFIEYAAKCEQPEKIPQLIDATWEDVKDEPVRETARKLAAYISQNQNEYNRPKTRTTGGRPKLTWKERFGSQYNKLAVTEKENFLKGFREFQKELKEAGATATGHQPQD